MNSTKIIAHRGASGYAPENTMAAFSKAIEMGAEGIELDVHLSRDRSLIVMHDEYVNRTSNGNGLIRDMTLRELKKLDCGSWYGEEFSGSQIPTLEEVLELLKNWDGILNIEIKDGSDFYPGIEKKVINTIRMFYFEEKVIFSSFNHYSIRDIKSNASYLKAGLLYGEKLYEPWNYARSVGAEALHPPFYLVDENLMNCCRTNNITVNTWTVNEECEMRKLVKFGVDGIITNYPDIAVKVRNEMQNTDDKALS